MIIEGVIEINCISNQLKKINLAFVLFRHSGAATYEQLLTITKFVDKILISIILEL
jgi:hypothetical protein